MLPLKQTAERPLLLPGAMGKLLRPAFAAILCALAAGSISAQQRPERLIDKDPFDEIVLTDEYGGKRYQIEEVSFPDGAPPANPDPNASFRFRFYDDNEDQYEVSWKDIKEFIPFPKRVLDQTRGYVQTGDYSNAYENLLFLKAKYPRFPGIDDLHHEFLYRNAVTFLSAGKIAESLALVEELSFADPNYRPTPADRTAKDLVNELADKIIGETLSKEQYEATRIWIDRFEREYGPTALPAVVSRKAQLAEASKTLLGQALANVDQKRFRKGKELLRQAMRAWPDNPEVEKLAKRIDEEFPTVVVAVRGFPARPDMTSLTNWDARRWGRLADQRLFEYSRLGAEGGDYACTIGKAGMSEDGSEFVIDIAPNRAVSRGLTGYDVSKLLLDLANPQSSAFSPGWSRLVDRVRVEEVNQVRVHFRKPHPAPAAFLSISLSDAAAGQLKPTFALNPSPTASTPTERSFLPTEPGRGAANRIVELVEKQFDDPREMATALVKGEVEVVDRIHLGDLPRLSINPQFSMRQYLLPTVHFLALNPRTPHLKNRSFRRGLAYAINAQAMFDGIILDGQTAPPGCRIVSGPFPAGMGASDPIAYAYDDAIAPRSYDPRLSLILFALARKDVENAAKAKDAEKKEEAKKIEEKAAAPEAKSAEAQAPDAKPGDAKPDDSKSSEAKADDDKPPPPPKIPIVLAYPQTPQARAVCGAIGAQLELVGIAVTLRPLPPGEVEDPTHDYDLLYVEAAIWEPLSDTRRLFAASGVAPTSSPYLNADLRRLDEARSWQEVATRLQQLHRTIFDEVPLIPLWQTYDFAAVRTSLMNVVQRPIWLYGDIENWQFSAESRSGGAR